MKKAIFLFICAGGVLAFLAGCGDGSGKTPDNMESTGVAEISGDAEASGAALPDAEITIPAGLVGSEMPGEIVPHVDENSSNVTYSLSGEERSDIVRQVSHDLGESIAIVLSDKDHYPHIVSISPDENYTEFVIELEDGQINAYEAMLAMSFYIVGNKYQIYNGVPVQEAVTTVRYVDAGTGSLISKTDSASMNTQ